MKKNLLILCAIMAFATLSYGQTVILDFEDAATSTTFQFFGGNLEGAMSVVIDNPNATGVNTSAKVMEFKKASDAPTWGGGFSNPNPTTAVDLSSAVEICVDVHMDHIGNLGLKLEEGSNGAGNWLQTQANTVMNDWETLCFDVTLNSEEDPIDPAAGNTYAKVVLFLDFGVEGNGTDEVVTYIDNIVISASVSTSNLDKANDLFEMAPTLVSNNALITFNNTANADMRQLSVVSATGQVLVRQALDGTVANYEINAVDWASGLYMVQVQEGKNVEVIKFMVH